MNSRTVTITEPILLLAFNRPDYLEGLIGRLREIQPTRVYVAIDGPREDRPEEAAKVQACRELVATIDWPCEIETLFQESNLGCGLGVSTAITWFFENVERGIILEDDLEPDPSFYGYCSELLDRYEHDPRVFAISGCNYVPTEDQGFPNQAYRFSQVAHIWGWATWRRSWEAYRLDIGGWRKDLPMRKLWKASGSSLSGSLFWAMTYELMARKMVDTWDAQFVYAGMRLGQYTATSNVNLIENIGFRDDATHTQVAVDTLPVQAISLPTVPVPVRVDEKADTWTREHHFRVSLSGIAHQSLNFGLRRIRGRV
jgi:hypothetical protein